MGLLESNEMKRKALILKPRCGFFCWEGSFSASLIRMVGLFFNLAKTLQCLLCLQRKRESNRPKKRGGRASLFLSAWRFIECHAASVWQEMLGVMAGFWRWLGQLLKVLEQRNYCLWWTDVSVCTPSSARFSLSHSIHFFSCYILKPTWAIYYGGLKSSPLSLNILLKRPTAISDSAPCIMQWNDSIPPCFLCSLTLSSLKDKAVESGLLIRAICVTPFTVVNSEGREPVSDWPPAVDMSHQWKTALWLVPACGERCSQICINFLPERQVRQIN